MKTAVSISVRTHLVTLSTAALWACFSAQICVGQVLWRIDFEDQAVGSPQDYSGFFPVTGPPPFVQVDAASAPYDHVMRMTVDASAWTSPWSVWWVQPLIPPLPNSLPADTYDTNATFLRFDACVSIKKPIHIKLYYNSQTSYLDTRNLEIDVTPTVAGAFQSFAIPLSSFAITWLTGNPPNAPTSMYFAMNGNPTNSAVWPCASNDVMMLDNIAYAIAPPLSIAQSNAGAVVSWPTNSAGFTLQECSAASGEPWTDVAISPSTTNGLYQLMFSCAVGPRFYRLKGP